MATTGCDAAIVSAFGDPGLAAAREFADIPVLGIEESAILTAWMLGRRYSIVCLTPRLRTWYIECAQDHGLAGRLASVRALDVEIPDITQAKTQLRERLLEECRWAVAQDEAEVIIFGGGPIAGLAREAAAEIPVPTLDGVSCAVRLAEAVVGLRPRQPRRGSFARPAPKLAKGLSPVLPQDDMSEETLRASLYRRQAATESLIGRCSDFIICSRSTSTICIDHATLSAWPDGAGRATDAIPVRPDYDPSSGSMELLIHTPAAICTGALGVIVLHGAYVFPANLTRNDMSEYLPALWSPAARGLWGDANPGADTVCLGLWEDSLAPV